MPLYYFDLWDGRQTSFDDTGLELLGLEAAFEEAVRGSRDMMRHMALKRRGTPGWAYQVRNEAGQSLFTVPFFITTVDQHYERTGFLTGLSTSSRSNGPHLSR